VGVAIQAQRLAMSPFAPEPEARVMAADADYSTIAAGHSPRTLDCGRWDTPTTEKGFEDPDVHSREVRRG
jgi:hypothetical protein